MDHCRQYGGSPTGELEQTGTNWNKLEQTGTKWNKMEQNGKLSINKT